MIDIKHSLISILMATFITICQYAQASEKFLEDIEDDLKPLAQKIHNMTIDDAKLSFVEISPKVFKDLIKLSTYFKNHTITLHLNEDELDQKMINLKNYIKVLSILSLTHDQSIKAKLIEIKENKLEVYKYTLNKYYEFGYRLGFKYVIQQAYLVCSKIEKAVLHPSNAKTFEHMRFDPQRDIFNAVPKGNWISITCPSEDFI